jgi:hypothetical protein
MHKFIFSCDRRLLPDEINFAKIELLSGSMIIFLLERMFLPVSMIFHCPNVVDDDMFHI